MQDQQTAYQPGTDQNQGIVGQMARAEQQTTFDQTQSGVAQNEGLSPSAMLPSPDPDLTQPVGEGILDSSGTETDGDPDDEDIVSAGVNDDMLTETDVEAHDIDVEGDENDRTIDDL